MSRARRLFRNHTAIDRAPLRREETSARLKRGPYDGNGGAERRKGLQGRHAPTARGSRITAHGFRIANHGSRNSGRGSRQRAARILLRLEQVPERRKFEGRAEFARGDADGGRRGRVDCFAIAEQLTGRPYKGKTNGVARKTHAAEDTSELSAAANAPAV